MEMILEQNYWQKLRRYNHLSRPNNLEICLTITTMTIHARYKVLYYKFYINFLESLSTRLLQEKTRKKYREY